MADILPELRVGNGGPLAALALNPADNGGGVERLTLILPWMPVRPGTPEKRDQLSHTLLGLRISKEKKKKHTHKNLGL